MDKKVRMADIAARLELVIGGEEPIAENIVVGGRMIQRRSTAVE